MKWFERRFDLDTPLSDCSVLIQRLGSTPARLAVAVRDVPSPRLVARHGNTWSMQENLGHLLDLEPLWLGRVEDMLAGRQELRGYDLTNQRTEEARHNDRDIGTIVSLFRSARAAFVWTIDRLDETQLSTSAMHPRLGRPMRVIDLMNFVAEHDDHHLARIRELATADAAMSL